MTLKQTFFGAAFVVMGAVALGGTAHAAGKQVHIEYQKWSFAGPFGHYDKAQLQRGYKVYREVCSSCHSLELVAFRNLAEPGGPGFTVDEVKAIAAEYEIEDGPDSDGEMFDRPGRASDKHPAPFPNEEAARASNNNAYPPDLSLIAKARAVERGFPTFLIDIVTQYQESGPDYLYSLLVGYKDPPEGTEIGDGQYYNISFLGGEALSMAPPLFDEAVEYTDGTPMTVDQYAKDVTAFLMWAAEPKLEERKAMGFPVMVFLVVFACLMYFSKRRLWNDVDH